MTIEGKDARLEFNGVTIPSGETAIFSGFRHDLFRPTKLVLQAKAPWTDDANEPLSALLVRGIFVGISSQTVNPQPLLGILFSKDTDVGVAYETMAPGVCFRFRVQNKADQPVFVSAYLEGTAVAVDWPEPETDPEPDARLKAAYADMEQARKDHIVAREAEPQRSAFGFDALELAPGEMRKVHSHRDRWTTFEVTKLILVAASGPELVKEGVEITDCDCGATGILEGRFIGPVSRFEPTVPQQGSSVLVPRGKAPTMTIKNGTDKKVRVYATMLGYSGEEPT